MITEFLLFLMAGFGTGCALLLILGLCRAAKHDDDFFSEP
jgi:hypothetical protein